jgi:hypothetical protein
MPGAPVTAVPWGNRFAVFITARNGEPYTAGGDPQNGFGPWASVSQGSSVCSAGGLAAGPYASAWTRLVQQTALKNGDFETTR